MTSSAWLSEPVSQASQQHAPRSPSQSVGDVNILYRNRSRAVAEDARKQDCVKAFYKRLEQTRRSPATPRSSPLHESISCTPYSYREGLPQRMSEMRALKKKTQTASSEHQVRLEHMRRRMRENQSPRARLKHPLTGCDGAPSRIIRDRKIAHPHQVAPSQSLSGSRAKSPEGSTMRSRGVDDGIGWDASVKDMGTSRGTRLRQEPRRAPKDQRCCMPPGPYCPECAVLEQRREATPTTGRAPHVHTPRAPIAARPRSAPAGGRRPEARRRVEGDEKWSQQLGAMGEEETSPAPADPSAEYRELRQRLVEQIVQNGVYGEAKMKKYLDETRQHAFDLYQELKLDPERCAETIDKLEADLMLDLS